MRRALDPSAWAAFLRAQVGQQADRWILWVPLVVLAGAAAWLLWPNEPPTWAGPSLMFLCVGAWALAVFAPIPSTPSIEGGRVLILALAIAGAALGLGASAAQWRADRVAAPRLAAPLEGVWLEGWVLGLEGGERTRMRILVRAIEGVEGAPMLVRISTRTGTALAPGRAVRCRVSLQPPAPPLIPGAYDFARRAYFMRLGAVGYVWGACRPTLAAPPAQPWNRALLKIAAMRADLSALILEAAPGRGGAIAAALIAGDLSAIDEDTSAALYDSGLGHLLSVSGLHMTVVGGLVFGALLLTFSLIPWLALRVTVRKLAAFGALIALGAYLVVSGASVPAIRAFIMAAVAFGAILIDRPAISMRGLALALLLIVLIYPESVLEPGFQMSFAATAALVAVFEATRRAPHEALPSPGPFVGALQSLGGALRFMVVTSLVAGLATDAFALFHFQRFALYGLVSNVAADPIITFVVAPMAGLAAIAAPFGLGEAPLSFMADALDLIAAIGSTFGERPEAVLAVQRPPDAFLPLVAMAVAWGCLWRGAIRWGALAWLGAAAMVAIGAPRPALAYDSEMRAIYVRVENEQEWRVIATARGAAFARERIGAQLGVPAGRIDLLAPPEGCDENACRWRLPNGHEAALVADAPAAERACGLDLVLARTALAPDFQRRCGGHVIDAGLRARHGGGLIWTEPALRQRSVSPLGAVRRWMSAPDV